MTFHELHCFFCCFLNIKIFTFARLPLFINQFSGLQWFNHKPLPQNANFHFKKTIISLYPTVLCLCVSLFGNATETHYSLLHYCHSDTKTTSLGKKIYSKILFWLVTNTSFSRVNDTINKWFQLFRLIKSDKNSCHVSKMCKTFAPSYKVPMRLRQKGRYGIKGIPPFQDKDTVCRTVSNCGLIMIYSSFWTSSA